MKSPILGGTYTARSVNLAAQRCVNLYAETAAEGGEDVGALFQCPGTSLFATAGFGAIRGSWEAMGVGYVVSGNTLYSVTAYGVATSIGTLVTSVGPVSMTDNGSQIVIADNPNMYVYNVSTEVFAQVNDPDFPGAVTVAFLDGYVIFNEPDSGRFWYTEIYDASNIDALSFATAEGSPDNILSILVDHREIWLFGQKTTEVWYNSGDADNPFQRIQGAFIEHGIVGPYACGKIDNTVFWVGSDTNGDGVTWRASGYTPQRVSSHAIETTLNGYGTLADCIVFTYQQEGHSFVQATFPQGNATWVYDIATNLWHERAYLDPVTGQLGRHRASCHMFLNQKHYIGDYQNGNIYEWKLGTYSDNGDAIKWLRAWRALPTGQNNLKRTTHHNLQIYCEAGVGLVDGQGDDPQMILEWSDDGGHTWSNQHSRTLGAMGKTGTRVIWRRLGSTEKLRDRVYRVSITDPVKVAIIGAELELSPNFS